MTYNKKALDQNKHIEDDGCQFIIQVSRPNFGRNPPRREWLDNIFLKVKLQKNIFTLATAHRYHIRFYMNE
jgi:hypothetical protein